MTAVAAIVHTSVKASLPREVHPSGFLWNFFSVVHKIHKIWRLYNKAEIYSNPNNFYALLAGHVVNFVFGESVFLRVAAQCVMIASRILKCVNHTVLLFKKGKRFVNACKGTAYTNRSVKKTEGIYSKTPKNNFQKSIAPIGERIKRIAIALFKLLKQVFILSMHFMDTIESFSISPSTRNENINEFFLNGTAFLDDLVRNQQRLLAALQDNRPIIDSVLKGIGSKVITTDALIEAVGKSVEVTSGVRTVANAGGGVVKNLLGHMLVGSAALVGLHRQVPKALLPDDDALFSQAHARKPTTPSKRPLSAATAQRIKAQKMAV